MAPTRDKSSSSTKKDKGKRAALSRGDCRRSLSRSRDRSPMDSRPRESVTLQDLLTEEPVVGGAVPVGAMVVPAEVLQGLAESVARTEEEMKKFREQQNVVDY